VKMVLVMVSIGSFRTELHAARGMELYNGTTALIIASLNGHLDIVKLQMYLPWSTKTTTQKLATSH